MADELNRRTTLFESDQYKVKPMDTELAAEFKGDKDPNENKSSDAEVINNQYKDIQLQKEEYTPNSEGLANTGQGASAASGTQYSWDKTGSEMAQTKYESDIETQRQNMLGNRQTLATNAVNYQTESDMMKYQSNQEAEKVGWAGGYVLDQNRQMEYLKQSIAAQMYGAMQLQKYGYDSALAAARLSYDLNQQEFAKQYYQQAVQNAMEEANITGTFFSAETKDMMAQLNAAKQEMLYNDKDSEAYKTAKQIEAKIEEWFKANNVSKEGVQTLASWQAKQDQALQYSNELWTRYQAAMASVKEEQANNASLFVKLDSNGDPIFTGSDVQTIDLSHTTAADTLDYGLYKKPDGTYALNKNAADQIYGYIDSLFESVIANYKQSVSKTDANGNTTYNINKDKLVETINGMLSNTISQYKKVYTDYVEKNGNDEYAKALKQIIDNYKYTFTDAALAGSKDITLNTTSITKDNITVTGNDSTITEYTFDDYKNNGYYGLTSYSNITWSRINTSKTVDNDIDVDYGKGIAGGTKNYNYDLDIDWGYQNIIQNAAQDFIGNGNNSGWNIALRVILDVLTGGSAEIGYGIGTAVAGGYNTNEFTAEKWNTFQEKMNEKYPNVSNGTFIIMEGSVWMYYEGKWGYVQHNVGGKKLLEDLTSVAEGQTPKRWQ